MPCVGCGKTYSPDCIICVSPKAMRIPPPIVANTDHQYAWGDSVESYVICTKCHRIWGRVARVIDLQVPCIEVIK